MLFTTKLYSFEKKRPYDHIFLRNPYSFVWIQHNCLTIMVFALNLSNSVIKRCCVSEHLIRRFRLQDGLKVTLSKSVKAKMYKLYTEMYRLYRKVTINSHFSV